MSNLRVAVRCLWPTVLLCARPVAQESAPQVGEAERAYAVIVAEHRAALQSFRAQVAQLVESDAFKKAAASRDSEALEKLRAQVPAPDDAAFAARMLEGARAHSGSDAAVRFSSWTVLQGDPRAAGEAFAILRKDHVASPALQDLLRQHYVLLRAAKANEVMSFLEDVIAANRDQEARAHAMFALAMRLWRAKDPSDADRDRVEELLAGAERLTADRDLVALTQVPRLLEQRLQVGNKAAEITGIDLDGEKLRLSDHRGRVVVLYFWGDW